MKVQRSHSVGLAALGCSMVLLSGNFVGSSAQVGCINIFLGDGWCDSANNNEHCNYDGGDCCVESCVDDDYVCGVNGYDCIDPDYTDDDSPSYSFKFSCDDDLAGNGNCDYDNNLEECDYDGGDCCVESCVDDDYVCGANGYDCIDPDYTDDDLTNDDLTNDDLTNDDLTNDDLTNDDLTNDDLTNDDLTNDDLTNDDLTNDDLTNDDSTGDDSTGDDSTDDDSTDDDYPSYSFKFSCDDDLAGNGNCDYDNNHEECGYDGGDCCYCTCNDTDEYTCGGGSGYNCIDPYASCVNDKDGYVEAGYSTTVGVSTNGYDDSGCGDDGCLPELTRDGDTEHYESRWSCASSLVPYGASCAITYTFKEQQHIRSVQVAFLKPDVYPRVVYVSADGVDLGHIESSSDTTFNLFGVEEDEISTVTITADDLTADEVISILEVRILVQVNHHY